MTFIYSLSSLIYCIMLANYGYKDGSGDFFITIDTDKCDACAKCVEACPAKVLELITDEADPFREIPVAAVRDEHRRKIKYSCAECKPSSNRPALPCMAACEAHLSPERSIGAKPHLSPDNHRDRPNAITHSW